MVPFRTLKSLRHLHGQRIVVRVDMNVPLENGQVVDDWRLRSIVPTIEYLHEKGAIVLLLAHIGRPEGVDMSLSLKPVVKHLSSLLNKDVHLIQTGNWEFSKVQEAELRQGLQDLIPGSIVCFENIRFAEGEEKNTPAFAAFLGSLGTAFVLDGFGVAHRDVASVTGIQNYLPSYAGLLFEKEVEGLLRLREHPESPFVVCLGGAKVETKIPLVEAFLSSADVILLGGALLPALLAVEGYGVGNTEEKEISKETVKMLRKKTNVIWPVDVVVGQPDGTNARVVQLHKTPHVVCEVGEGIFDIGPETIRNLAPHIKRARMLLWNGAFGRFEISAYRQGTYSLAQLFAARAKGPAFGVVGGGETVEVVRALHLEDTIDMVSTGGGAMLELLVEGTLPGLKALQIKK